MKNYRSEGKTLNLIAPAGGVTSGNPYIIGGIFCVAMGDADAGETFVGLVEGVAGLTKASGTTAAAGAAAYFNETSGLMETSDADDNRRIGVFAEAATSGNTNARVRLDGKSFGDGDADLESKVDKIASPVAGNMVVQTSGGGIADGDIAVSSSAVDFGDRDLACALVAETGAAESESLTIASGVITPSGDARIIVVSPEGDTDDDLDTIDATNVRTGTKLLLMASNWDAEWNITLTSNGNLDWSGFGAGAPTEFELPGWLAFVYDGTSWVPDPSAFSPMWLHMVLEGEVNAEYLDSEDGDGLSIPVMIRQQLSGATSYTLASNLDDDYRVVDVWVRALATNTGGTVKLTDGTHDITDVMTCTTEDAITHAASIDEDYAVIYDHSGELQAVPDDADSEFEICVLLAKVETGSVGA